MTKKPPAPPAPKPAPQQPQDSGMAYDSVMKVNPAQPPRTKPPPAPVKKDKP